MGNIMRRVRPIGLLANQRLRFLTFQSEIFQCLFKHYKCITGVVVQKRHNGPCAGEERLTDKDFFNGPLVKDRLSSESFKIIEIFLRNGGHVRVLVRVCVRVRVRSGLRHIVESGPRTNYILDSSILNEIIPLSRSG